MNVTAAVSQPLAYAEALKYIESLKGEARFSGPLIPRRKVLTRT